MSDQGYSNYDPNTPEGAEGGTSQYVSKKDVRVILVALAVLAAITYPVYKLLEKNAQRSVCATNLGGIARAISQYAEMHDERFPPLMRTGPNNEPDLGTTGMPYTWASDVAELMSGRASFRCPAAGSDEVTRVEGHGGALELTYGMYAPYSGYLRTVVPNPDQTVLIAETSNLGSADTYDPLPYVDLNGRTVPYDGFAIGWDNSNDQPDSKSRYVTRLAMPGSKNGEFKKLGDTRHNGGIHALNCSGAMLPLIKADGAILRIQRGLPTGRWEAPPPSAAR